MSAWKAADATRILLTSATWRELRMQLLRCSSRSSLELVEQRYDNGDVVVRLAQPGDRDAGEDILGYYNDREKAP